MNDDRPGLGERAKSESGSALDRVTLQMTGTLELGLVLSAITRGLVTELDAALARIWLYGPGERCATCAQGPHRADDQSYLHLRASSGLSERIDGTYHRIPIGSFKLGEIARTLRPVCTNDLAGDPRIVDKAWVRDHDLASFAGYALTFRGELLGVLALFGRHALSGAEFERIGLFAAQAAIAIKNAQLYAEVEELKNRLLAENAYLKEEIHREPRTVELIGTSAALGAALRQLQQVAPTAATVLLHGETGTGKELFAQALHDLSPRRQAPLIKMNCAAIPTNLFESELFGHERGAFTGATQRRIGRFELAHGGTLLLDEIGELPLEIQAKLLRVLQEQEFERVGGSQPLRTDVRLVAATNRDLAAEVRAGRFRADLFYRLNIFPVVVPPLRARRSDIPLLAAAFLRHKSRQFGKPLAGLTQEAEALLIAYDWPGNVRELHNVLERAAILVRGDRIGLAELPTLTPAAAAMALPKNPVPADESLSAAERAHVLRVLEKTDWIIEGKKGAAAILQVPPSTLRSSLLRLGIKRPGT